MLNIDDYTGKVYDVVYRIDGCTHTIARYNSRSDAEDYIATHGSRVDTRKGSRKLYIIEREW